MQKTYVQTRPSGFGLLRVNIQFRKFRLFLLDFFLEKRYVFRAFPKIGITCKSEKLVYFSTKQLTGFYVMATLVLKELR